MLEALFDRAKSSHRAAIVPYVMAGDPDPFSTLQMLGELTQAGVDMIELGIPYGDPLADGPTIAAAGQRALDAGMTLRGVLEMVQLHKATGGAPIVLFTYFNPIYQFGIEAFAHEAAQAGASGVIVPDIPLEEAAELSQMLATEGVDMPMLVAPSTGRERLERIAHASTGFIYVVSRLGVTGAGRQSGGQTLRAQISALRGITEKPLAVGFGVSTPSDVRDLATLVDGVIIGSALIDAYASHAAEEAPARVREFIDPIVDAANYAPV